MTINDLIDSVDYNAVGKEIYALIEKLFPICRSITGDGVRQTLKIISEHIPIELHDVPSGTEVFDWTVPKEWNIRDAYVKNLNGKRIIDFKKSNLHVMGYSIPIRKKVSLEELKRHLYTLPDHPDWIPYRHSYYKEDWGFCIQHSKLNDLQDAEYEVCIDSSLKDGFLTLGELLLKGEVDDEVVIFTHTCHPSLCNDNLSGIGVATFLAKWFLKVPRRYSYRFLFCPTTIGSITWLALHEKEVDRIKHGLILTSLGDPGGFTYKKTRRGGAEIDRCVINVIKHSEKPFEVYEFSPFGYDERQFCSPGFNLPFGCLMRTPNGKYPEYHTSADNLNFVTAKNLGGSIEICADIIIILEQNRLYISRNPKCEPQLGKRGLFRSSGRRHLPPDEQFALLWVLNLSDGSKSLLDISDRSGISFDQIKKAANALLYSGLLQESAEKCQ